MLRGGGKLFYINYLFHNLLVGETLPCLVICSNVNLLSNKKTNLKNKVFDQRLFIFPSNLNRL
jgi:hypothetical protein